jgi:hypothetical protein
VTLSSAPNGTETEPLYCANHPTVPTYLRCGRCEKPICARCRVATPVGYRCFQCANLTSLPTYAVSSTYYARSALVGFGVATLIGLIWAALPGYDFWAALAMGLLVSEAVAAAANQKRGPGLQVVGLAATIWGIVLSRAALALMLTNLSLYNLIMQIPGNGFAPALRGGAQLARMAADANVGGIFVALVQGSDVVSLLFVIMARGLTYIRLR